MALPPLNGRGERRAKRVRSSASLAVDSALRTPPISLHLDALDNVVTRYRVMTKPSPATSSSTSARRFCICAPT